MLKEIMVTRPVCDWDHKQDQEARRFLVIDPVTKEEFTLDMCTVHRRKTPMRAVKGTDGQVAVEGAMTTAEAARLLGLSVKRVQLFSANGTLEVVREARGREPKLLSRESVEALLQERGARPLKPSIAVKRAAIKRAAKKVASAKRKTRQGKRARARARKSVATVPSGNGRGYSVPSTEDWLNAPDAAALLGNPSISNLSKWAKEGKLEQKKVGPRRALYSRKSVDALAAQRAGAEREPVKAGV